MVVDDLTGIELTIDLLDDETAETQLAWLREIAELVGAEVLTGDDADALKRVADELGLSHQMCRAHVTQNVLRLVGGLGSQALEAPDPVPQGVTRSLEQFLADLEKVQWLVEAHPHDGQEQLEALHQYYCQAPAPREGEKASMWYRIRYQSMRGYKRPESALNVSSLLGWLGGQPAGYNLAELVAA